MIASRGIKIIKMTDADLFGQEKKIAEKPRYSPSLHHTDQPKSLVLRRFQQYNHLWDTIYCATKTTTVRSRKYHVPPPPTPTSLSLMCGQLYRTIFSMRSYGRTPLYRIRDVIIMTSTSNNDDPPYHASNRIHIGF